MYNITGTLTTYLTGRLQELGVSMDSYYKISNAMEIALCDLDCQINEGDCIELPSGRCLIAGKKIGIKNK